MNEHGIYPTVEQAEKALSDAKARKKAQRKAEKKRAKLEARRQADYELGMDTLREIAGDEMSGSSARIAAVEILLARSGK